MLKKHALLLFDDGGGFSAASLNSLLQLLAPDGNVCEVVVVISAEKEALVSGLNVSIPLRVVVAQKSALETDPVSLALQLVAELQLDPVIPFSASQLDKLGSNPDHSDVRVLIENALSARSETTESNDARAVVSHDRKDIWSLAPLIQHKPLLRLPNGFGSTFLRHALVCVCLIAIGAATLGLFLPSAKSSAVAANDGKVNPAPVVEQLPQEERQLASNPSAVPAKKPPIPKAAAEATKPAASVVRKPIEWRPVELDQSPEAIELRLKNSSGYLASDELEGRGVRTHGIDLAADYLAREFKAAGLKTDLVQGQPFQEFELYAIGRERVVQDLLIKVGDDKRDLVLDRDFSSLMAATSSQSFDLELVFVGYGVTLTDGKYDDYAGLDVEGKAVIVLRNLPPHLAKVPANSPAAFVRNKVTNAVEHGAAAIIFCSDAASLRAANSGEPEPIIDTLLRVDLANDVADPMIPIVHCQRTALVQAIIDSGFDLDLAESQITRTTIPQSKLIDKAALYGRSSQARVGRKLKNVLASVTGEGDKAEQTIVVGAHYDHLGRGGYGSLSFSGERDIHNGADDNASGTAVMLEVARQLSARKKPLARRVLFAGFSGEELGLVGSKRYVREPVVPLNKTVAMLNLDMVGRLREGKLTIYGGETSPMWPKLLDDSVSAKDFSISRRAGGFGPSDHASFYEKGIPVLHFFTGFHPQYHRPGDDAELLNIEGMRQITNLVVELVVALADPEMQPSHRAQSEPLLTDASPGIFDDVLSGRTGRRPSMLGVVLGPVVDGSGLVIDRTLPGSLAQKFGIRVGDMVHELDGKPVNSSDDMIAIVRSKKPNDELKLLIERNGVKLEVKVKF